jgi:hypothetical protein
MKKALLLIIVLMMSSCATLFTGTKEMITVTSNVDNATVKFDGINMGSTPLVTKVKKSFDGMVSVEADGYKDERFQLQKSFQPVAILNLFNILWWGVDFITGAVNKFDMKGYDIELKEEEKE